MTEPAEVRGDPGPVAEHLRRLLAQPGPYRSRWMREARRVRPGQINDAAVARVVTEYLSTRNELGSAAGDYRSLKDRVHRALNGQVMTVPTLWMLIEAFDMEDRDAQELWVLFGGLDEPSVVAGNLRTPAGFSRRNFQTLTLLDFHTLGLHGLPVRHRTMQVIRALDDGLDRYPYRFDLTTTASVEVISGGTASQSYDVNDDLHAVDILLPGPLKRGETATLEYVTNFDYQEPPAPEFKRAATNRIENLSIRVEFHTDKPPTKIWWVIWADYRNDSPMLVRETVDLAADNSVNRHIDVLEQTVAGFSWMW